MGARGAVGLRVDVAVELEGRGSGADGAARSMLQKGWRCRNVKGGGI